MSDICTAEPAPVLEEEVIVAPSLQDFYKAYQLTILADILKQSLPFRNALSMCGERDAFAKVAIMYLEAESEYKTKVRQQQIDRYNTLYAAWLKTPSGRVSTQGDPFLNMMSSLAGTVSAVVKLPGSVIDSASDIISGASNLIQDVTGTGSSGFSLSIPNLAIGAVAGLIIGLFLL